VTAGNTRKPTQLHREDDHQYQAHPEVRQTDAHQRRGRDQLVEEASGPQRRENPKEQSEHHGDAEGGSHQLHGGGKPLEHDIDGWAILVPRCAEVAMGGGCDVVVQLNQNRLVEAELLRHGVTLGLRGRQGKQLIDGVGYPMGQEKDQDEHDHDDDGRVEQTEEDVSDQLSLLPGKQPSVESGDPPT
jgi:hypothetical protein